MTDTRARFARTLGRRGLLTALVSSAALYVVLLVQGTLISLLTSISRVAVAGATAPAWGAADLGTSLAQIWGDRVAQSLLTELPFAVGVFLALWQILPIAPELRFAYVVTRALFAAGVGAVAVLLVLAVQAVVLVVAGLSGSGFGTAASVAGREIGLGLLGALLRAVQAWVLEVPLVVLVGLLLWGWMQRFPPRHGPTGMLDEL